MPRIPQFTPQQTLRTSTFQESRIGTSLVAIGQQLEQQEEERAFELEQLRQEKDESLTAMATSEFVLGAQDIYNQAMDAADEDGTGFTDAVTGLIDADIDQRTSSMSPQQAQMFRMRALSIRTNVLSDAMQEERERNFNSIANRASQNLSSTAIAVRNGSMGLNMAMATSADMIQNIPGVSNPTEMIAQQNSALAMAHVEGMFEQERYGDITRFVQSDTWAQYGDVENTDRIRDRVQAGLEAQQVSNRYAVSLAQENVLALSRTQPPGNIDPAQMALAMSGFEDENQATVFRNAFENNQRLYRFQSGLQQGTVMTPQVPDILEGFQPDPSSPTYADDLDVYEQAVNVYSSHIQTVLDDPAGAVERSGLVPEGPLNEASVDASMVEQMNMGVLENDVVPLSQGRVESLVGALSDTQNPEAVMQARNILSDLGAHSGAAMQQLIDAGLHEDHFAYTLAGGDLVAIDAITPYIGRSDSEFTERIESADKTELDLQFHEEIAGVYNAIWLANRINNPNSDVTTDNLFGPYRRMAYDLYANGSTAGDIEDTLANVLRPVLTHYQAGDTFAVPSFSGETVLGQQEIVEAFENPLNEDVLRSFRPMALESYMSSDADFNYDETIEFLTNEGFFVNTNRGLAYAVEIDGIPRLVVDEQNQPLEFVWGEVNLSAEAGRVTLQESTERAIGAIRQAPYAGFALAPTLAGGQEATRQGAFDSYLINRINVKRGELSETARPDLGFVSRTMQEIDEVSRAGAEAAQEVVAGQEDE